MPRQGANIPDASAMILEVRYLNPSSLYADKKINFVKLKILVYLY
jgi:hypothetical protein